MRVEQMDMDWTEDWGDKEFMEHLTLEMMMKDLDIFDEDMEVEYKGEDNNVHLDEYWEFDDELEHSFLDNILEGMEMDREPNYEEVEMVMDTMESAPVLEPEVLVGDCLVVPGVMANEEQMVHGDSGDMNTRQSQTETVIVNTEAYHSEGTWIQNNWVNKNEAQGEEKAKVPKCKNMLGCACLTSGMSKNEDGPFVRMLRPVSGDCMLSRKRYKRSRKERTKWWEGVVEPGARRWITARRRHSAQVGGGVRVRDE